MADLPEDQFADASRKFRGNQFPVCAYAGPHASASGIADVVLNLLQVAL